MIETTWKKVPQYDSEKPVYNSNTKGFRKKCDTMLAPYSSKQINLIYAIYKAGSSKLNINPYTRTSLDKKGVINIHKDEGGAVSLSAWGIIIAKRILTKRGEDYITYKPNSPKKSFLI